MTTQQLLALVERLDSDQVKYPAVQRELFYWPALSSAIRELVKALEAMRDALVDIRDHGCRHDTNPTMDHEWTTVEWYNYLKLMDDRVRARAADALTTPAAEGKR